MTDTKKLSSVEIQHIAHLARLPVADTEIEHLADQLSQTTTYIDVLNELDTTKVEPTSQINHKKNVFRDDKIEPSFSQSEALSQASNTYQGFFKTSATIKK